MARSRFHRSLGYRAEQTGLLIATGNVPLTFQRTLMPRTTTDQALITGLVVRGQSRVDEPRPGVAPIGCAPAHRRCRPRAQSISAGGAAPPSRSTPRRSPPDSACNACSRRVPDERLPRAGARTGGF